MDKFVVTPKEDKSVIMTIRIERSIQSRLDELAKVSNRSRNELINVALAYALNNLEFVQEAKQEENT